MAFSACSSDGDDLGSLKDSNANKNVVSASVPTEATGLEFPKIVANGISRNVVLVRRTADYGVTYSTYYDLDKKSPRWCCYQIFQSNNKKNGPESSGKVLLGWARNGVGIRSRKTRM